MKRPPQARALIEYGKALVELRITKEEYPSRAPCCVRSIKDAWAKRKACRRTCGDCIHFRSKELVLCDIYNPVALSHSEATCCEHYKPRKEGK